MHVPATRRHALSILSAAAVLGASIAPAANASPSPRPTPNAQARHHGITRLGDATMGWTSKPNVKSGPTSGTNPKADQLVRAMHLTGSDKSTRALASVSQTAGLDLSNHTKGERWATWKANGVRFIYTKATEGTYTTNADFSRQYSGATSAGIIRGAYHFANPSVSDGRTQADYFVNHGGGWSRDGRTLPGALDMEWNPYSGNSCYGKTQAQLQKFVADFVGRYKQRTGTRPIIYTASSWWNRCMGPTKWTSTPLWIAHYASTAGTLPTAWSSSKYIMWQNAAYDTYGYDTDLFNGSLTSLRRYATNGA